MILKMLSLGPFGVNSFVVGCEETKEGMIIDPGDDAATILATARQYGLQVKLIVNTHTHIDHVLALREVKEATNAQFLIHQEELETLRHGPEQAMMLMGIRVPAPPEPDQFLTEGDTVKVGNLSFKVLHTPGHTPGGICLYGEGVVFTGDTLFNFSIGRTDFNPDPSLSYHELIESIQTKLMPLPDETKVLSGHGPASTIGAERQYNPFLA